MMANDDEVIVISDSDSDTEDVNKQPRRRRQRNVSFTDEAAFPIPICRFFLRGDCRYGNLCNYLHIRPTPVFYPECDCPNPLHSSRYPVDYSSTSAISSSTPASQSASDMTAAQSTLDISTAQSGLDMSTSQSTLDISATQSSLDMSPTQPPRVNILMPTPPIQINVINSPNSGAQIQVINNFNLARQPIASCSHPVDGDSQSANTLPQTVTSSTLQSVNGAPNPIQFQSTGPYRPLNVMAPVFVPTTHRQALSEAVPTTSHASLDSDLTNYDEAETAPVSSTSTPATYADVVTGSRPMRPQPNRNILCPFAEICPNIGKYCEYQHYGQCATCKVFCLHPFDMEARREHIANCTWQHQLTTRSKDKVCGICFDRILEKPGKDRLFGLLPNCFHVFCLDCLRRWRRAEHFDREITRGCPECRISSNFVCPCPYWVENKEEKDRIIECYKNVMSEKDCKYFKKGEGTCPFGNKCFYKHALPNGKKVDVGQPARHVRRVQTSNEEILNLIDIYMWEFVDRRNQLFNAVNIIGDSDDSDAVSDDFDLEC